MSKVIMVPQDYRSLYGAFNRFTKDIYARLEARGFQITSKIDGTGAFYLHINDRAFEDGEIWDNFESADMPIFNLIVDKPESHWWQIHHCTSNTTFSFVDKKHTDVFMRNVPLNNRSVFLPHGGSESALPRRPFAERDIDILFIGSYADENDAIAVFNKLDSPLAATDEDYGKLSELADTFMADAALSPYDCFNILLRQNNITARTERFAGLFRRLSFSLDLLRCRCRDETIKRLCDAGLVVTVYGRGWERFEYIGHPNFNYMGECLYDEGIDIMTRAKVSLNIVPTFRHGGHERLFSSMLNGAACLSTVTYAFPDIIDGENVLFYNIADFDKTVESVKDLLANEPRRRRITDAAYATADKSHRWAHRADAILDVMGFGDAPRP